MRQGNRNRLVRPRRLGDGARAGGDATRAEGTPAWVSPIVAPLLWPRARHRAGRMLASREQRLTVRRGYPLSLSISISGGKETNKDSLSNGERTGKSPP
ncbi:hypothetical protein RIF29_02536 [Crotalaria pallida]|uniref:Uncharacterized protein n=1 Tax=Crotalaria pallida TaxID=3830 RepID=A0AAN9P849_CROPI